MKHFFSNYQFPSSKEPKWAGLVERWYQLDAAAYGLTEVYWQNRKNLTRPDVIFLASPGASNFTDLQFAKAPSPAKFVHTLPNIRVTPMLKVMEWSGLVFCLQKDPVSILTAIEEARQSHGVRWVVSALPSFEAHIFELDSLSKPVISGFQADKDWLLSLKVEQTRGL